MSKFMEAVLNEVELSVLSEPAGENNIVVDLSKNSRESNFKAHVVVFKPFKMSQFDNIVHQAWKTEMTL